MKKSKLWRKIWPDVSSCYLWEVWMWEFNFSVSCQFPKERGEGGRKLCQGKRIIHISLGALEGSKQHAFPFVKESNPVWMLDFLWNKRLPMTAHSSLPDSSACSVLRTIPRALLEKQPLLTPEVKGQSAHMGQCLTRINTFSEHDLQVSNSILCVYIITIIYYWKNCCTWGINNRKWSEMWNPNQDYMCFKWCSEKVNNPPKFFQKKKFPKIIQKLSERKSFQIMWQLDQYTYLVVKGLLLIWTLSLVPMSKVDLEQW